jgi:hypothetical protein
MKPTAHAQRRLCEREAIRCYIRAKWSTDERRANFLALERHWTVERLEQFLDARKVGTSKNQL